MKKVILNVLMIILFIPSFIIADVELPAIISDNMVLQQDTNVTIWGWGQPGEKITICPDWYCSGQTDVPCVITKSDGTWKIHVRTPKAGGPYTIKITGNNTIEVKNVLIGEVWICSGQSNMEMPMKDRIQGGPEDIACSANKSIRLFVVARELSDTPLDNLSGRWVECSPKTVRDFSAVGYYFGRNIYTETGYPVGMIQSAWGGTIAEAWMRIDYLKNDDNLKRHLDWYNGLLEQWKKDCLQAEKEHKPKPEKQGGIRPQNEPSAIYNAMIAPITNMTIKGVIWYQGESNAGNPDLYRDTFPTLITNWRCDFRNFQMPFYFVQLASYTTHKPGTLVEPYRGEPRNHNWAALREAQLMTNALKNTGMAVTIDIGESNTIHPKDKKDVGERLALWALAKNYDKDIEYSGPLYQGYWIEGEKIRIAFSCAESGLVFKDGKVRGFAIAGKDKQFVWADAEIDGTTILVFSAKIKQPVAVRYAWDIDPEICLYNKAYLPASPFRTDDWK